MLSCIYYLLTLNVTADPTSWESLSHLLSNTLIKKLHRDWSAKATPLPMTIALKLINSFFLKNSPAQLHHSAPSNNPFKAKREENESILGAELKVTQSLGCDSHFPRTYMMC